MEEKVSREGGKEGRMKENRQESGKEEKEEK